MFRFSTTFRSHGFPYSTICPISPNRNHHLLVDYLTESLRFSKQDDISISTKSKVTHLKSTINPDLVLNIFKIYGLNPSQIRQIVSSVPKILTCKANKTLEPKLRVFQELGLSGSDLVTLIKKHPEIFGYGLHTRILPCLKLLRKVLGSDDKVIEAINKSRWLSFTSYSMKRISKNVSLLRN
ncbi:hypothetical protein L6452_04961 [Arctium lappa]|uniref:Uncharacterized protein n=1 Tax=Arctium lappa TaxID=4217 RepID=A0ACB9EEP1_ARCLA|nr:hypothetical protein L6452_04961 [Arctium lappa]